MRTLFRRCRLSFVPVAGLTLLIAVTACGGGNVSLAPQAGSSSALPAATTRTCFTPATSAQTVALGNTGGITGSLSVAGSSAAATSCNVAITFSTETDAASTLAVNRRVAQSTSAKPLLEISLDNAFTNNVEITGAVLNTPSNLSFPDGTYQALVTSGSLPPTVLTFTASNGVLTLASTGSPIVVFPGTTATLTLYGKGVTPPSSTPTPTPAASASANPSATPTVAPTATASATPTAVPTATAMPTTPPTPTPAPSAGTIVASSITLSPGSSCIATGDAGGPISFSVSVVTNAPPGTQFEYGWESGSGFVVSVPPPTMTYPNLSYLSGYTVGYANTATITAPAFPMGSLVGGSGNANVVLLRPPYSFYLDPTPILKADGSETIARVTFEGGTNTCP